jgi:hypothetical protein
MREARIARQRERYPELEIANFDEMFAADAATRLRTNSPLTQFGRDAEDLAVRNLPTDDERRPEALQSFQDTYLGRSLADPDAPQDKPFVPRVPDSPRLPEGFIPLQPVPQSPVAPRVPAPGGRGGTVPFTPFAPEPERPFHARLASGIADLVTGIPERKERAGESIRIGAEEFSAVDFNAQLALDFASSPVTRDDPGPLGPAAQILRGGLAAGAGVDPKPFLEHPLAPVSGREFLELILRSQSFNEVGLADIGLGEDTTPRLVNELIEALAPINFVIAGSGAGAAAAIRQAAAQRGRSPTAKRAMEAFAGAIEPFAGRGAPALGREIAADVGFQEAFAATEGAPAPVRFAAGLAGGLAGGFSPEILKAPGRLPISAGLSLEDIGGDLDNARAALLEGVQQEIRIRGTAVEELTAGRAAQALGIEERAAEGARLGLTGTELAEFTRSGARVGTIRQTFAAPIELTARQSDAMSDELTRLRSDGDLEWFEFLQAGTALSRLQEGAGLRQFELDAPWLPLLLGDDAASALRQVPPVPRVEPTGPLGKRVAIPETDLPAARPALLEGLSGPDVPTAGLPGQPQLTAAAEAAPVPGRFPQAPTGPLGERVPVPDVEPLGVRGSLPGGEAPSALGPTVRVPETFPPPFGKLELERQKVIREFNDADEVLRRTLSRENEAAITKQLNARTRAEARAARQGFNLTEALESRHPNSEVLLDRVRTLMNQPVTGTPRGDIPVGESGRAVGPRGTPPTPRVPVELQEDVLKTIDLWLSGTEARLAHETAESAHLVRSIQAQLNGQLESPLLTMAVYRRTVLAEMLTNQGVESQVARRMADVLMDEQLGLRLGDGFLEIRTARRPARTRVRNRIRAETGEQFVDDTTDEFRQQVDQELADVFTDRLGAGAVAQEKHINDQLAQLNTGQGWQKVDDFVQASKNTQFGLWDVGVFGLQVPTAVNRGGVSLLAKMIDDALAVLHLPNARSLYTESFLPKQAQYASMGVDQSARAAVYEAGNPSLIGLLGGKPGRAIDRPLIRIADAMTEFQFGTVLGAVRNAAYEGTLALIHVAGLAAKKFNVPGNYDVTDPLVPQTAAAFANHTGSSALPALRGNRNVAERILTTSSRMFRARVNHITLAAKLLTPQASAAERVLAATTIVSSVAYTLAFAKFVNEIVGLTPFEMDPSKPGFGLITVPDPIGDGVRVIDTEPQDSVNRAFMRSIRALKEGDPQLAAQAWARVWYGSASIVGRVPTTAFGYGYEPGVGFREGDMTTQGQIENLLPIPPIFQFLHEEGLNTFGATLEVGAIGNFPEGSYGQGNRLLMEAGIDPAPLTNRERKQALADLGVLHEISSLQREELEDRAERGDREAEALLVKYDKQDELFRIFEDVQENGGGKPGYRARRREAAREFAIISNTYDAIWRGFAESDNEVQRLAGERYELRDQATTGTETDFDTLEELEAVFDAALDPTVREDVMAYINAIDPEANPWEQEYDLLQVTLADQGWYEIDSVLWSELTTTFPDEIQGARSFYEFREQEQQRIREEAQGAGFTPGEVEGVVRSQWASNIINQTRTDERRERRGSWAIASQRNLELAAQASEWGLWAPPDDIEDAFSRLTE